MSDSELSDAPSNEIPPDSEIIASLRAQVTKASKGPAEDFTKGKIRSTVETSLGLPADFFKGDEKWSALSSNIIKEQLEKVEPVSSPPSKQQTKAKRPPKTKSEPKKPVKRASPVEKSRPRKKQKLDSEKEEEETSALSSPPSDSDENFSDEPKPRKGTKTTKATKPPTPKAKPKPKPKPKTQENDSVDEEMSGVDGAVNAQDKADDSGSELSDVLDEPPSKKPRTKTNPKSTDPTSKPPNPKSKPKPKPKPKPDTEPDPDAEEIKKLQSWLVKCGIRKVWGKELKPHTTPKAKIRHLREMLTDAGMTGRYSNEKAAQIKESRELAADIEAVQEGNERWGKSEDENGDGGDGDKTRSGRRLVRGAKNYDFLSSDGEETD